MKRSLPTSVSVFKEKLCKILREEKADEETILSYQDAIQSAQNYCISCFSKEFGSYGGQFTSHGPDHAAMVLRNILCLSERFAKQLSGQELYLLGIAAILHDVGMTAPLPESLASATTDEDKRWDVRRRLHGEATADLLKTCEGAELKRIEAADPQAYELLPNICAAHCTSGFRHNTQVLWRKAQANSHSCRCPSLAGVLLLADELDLGGDRAKPSTISYPELKSPITRAHWWKHWLVNDVSLDGGVIRIMHLSKASMDYAEEFMEWTKAKLAEQLQIVRDCLDPNGNEAVWHLDISVTLTESVPWHKGLPDLTTEVVEAAQQARLKIPGQKLKRIIDPERLIDRVEDSARTKEPSLFFRKAIAKRIFHFRGQGQHVTPAHARELYVEQEANMDLLQHATHEWEAFTSGSTRGVNLKVFVGDIGVGKTHFLSVFLHEVRKRQPQLSEKTLFVRAELTECDPGQLLDAQRHVATELYKELARLGIASRIREIMLEYYKEGNSPQIPALLEEIGVWTVEQINQFLFMVGSLCRSESDIRRLLADQAPTSLCIFLDNSDHLNAHLVTDLYNWCNNLSGRTNCLVWMFLRPETFELLQIKYQRSAVTLRSPEPIYAPDLRDVVIRRIDKLADLFKSDERVQIPYGRSFSFTPSDIREAVGYISGLALQTAEDILPKLTGRTEGKSQSNLRGGLAALIDILGSHVLTDDIFIDALALRKQSHSSLDKSSTLKSGIEKWARVLEALILGRRVWYSANCGAVENLLDFPGISESADYFLIIHLLQLLEKRRLVTFGDACSILARLDYQRARVQQAIQHLSTRAPVLKELSADENPFTTRTFPLATVNCPTTGDFYKNTSVIRITPWGQYHLTLLEQAQYWKHISYQIIFPSSFAMRLSIDAIHHDGRTLADQLAKIFDYLIPIEESRLCRKSEDELSRSGFRKIIPGLRDRVLHQLLPGN